VKLTLFSVLNEEIRFEHIRIGTITEATLQTGFRVIKYDE